MSIIGLRSLVQILQCNSHTMEIAHLDSDSSFVDWACLFCRVLSMLVIDALTTLRNAMYAVVDFDSLWLRGHAPDLVCGKLAVCHN